MIGKQRSQALWRVAAFIYMFLASLVLSVVATVAILWGVIDVLWQLLSNRNTLSEDSFPARLVKATYMWTADLFLFSTTGGGTQQLNWTPSPWL